MKHKKGQILLITVMLLATVMTVVLAVSFKSTTDTQVTKLEEENQKALAAAESAIEVALKENATAIIGTGSLTSISGFTGSATIDTSTSMQFTTPNILKDGSYTFYLASYNPETKTITGASDGRNVAICFQSGPPVPALDVTLIKSASIKKYVVDPSTRITNAYSGLPVSELCPSGYNYSITVPGADVNGIGFDGKFLLVRVLYGSTKLLFAGRANLPIQGRTITSQATSSTSTGVSKKVVLFQSYPQIPGEFFSTSF